MDNKVSWLNWRRVFGVLCEWKHPWNERDYFRGQNVCSATLLCAIILDNSETYLDKLKWDYWDG